MKNYNIELDLLKSKEQTLHINLSEALMEENYAKIIDVCQNLILVTSLQQEYYQLHKGVAPHLHHEKSKKMRHYEAMLTSFSQIGTGNQAAAN